MASGNVHPVPPPRALLLACRRSLTRKRCGATVGAGTSATPSLAGETAQSVPCGSSKGEVIRIIGDLTRISYRLRSLHQLQEIPCTTALCPWVTVAWQLLQDVFGVCNSRLPSTGARLSEHSCTQVLAFTLLVEQIYQHSEY